MGSDTSSFEGLVDRPIEVIFLPGMLCDQRVWHPVWRACQNFELPQGTSAVFIDYTDPLVDSMSAMAEHALAASSPNAIRIFVGFSMGGHIAFEIARQDPEAVTGLMIVCSSAGVDSEARKQNRRKLISLPEDFARFDGITNSIWPKYVRPENLNNHDMLALVQDMAREHGLAGAKAQARALLNRKVSHDTLRDLGACGVPLSICGSPQDQVVAYDASVEMVRAHGSAVLTELNAGHLGPLEDADTVAQVLENLIGKVSVARTAQA